jgi:hypothetical protein
MTVVSAIARLKIHDGKLEEFKGLAALCSNQRGSVDADEGGSSRLTEEVLIGPKGRLFRVSPSIISLRVPP